ncbi:outer membrane protein A [Vibrio ruber DSM 16370]|uniref:Outer membrane protein A n=1 Tax=Vibrio ruber (strain DSM 16370 / JCM 11486 / BCRC 17186 / CECT 7878 / LMG 23124 / VR1) TaxID=1123498 RepID=A0A1R4LRL3_VIBR1|nr:porin family protein [Vibrio ruber]SJN58957.1 outer membrane protein A [Vibrio ruber DSM 16370]
MKKILPILASTMALTTFSTISNAAVLDDESGIYVGGNYGYVKIDGQDDFDDDNDVMQGLIGFKLNRYIGIEGSYIDFGSYGGNVASAETDGYTAALKLTAPIGDRVELYAKGGQLWYTTDYDILGVSGDEDDEAVFAGAGVGFKVTDNFLVNAEYTWYDVDLNANDINNGADTNTDLKQATIGAEYRF